MTNIAGLTLPSSSREQGVKHGEEPTTTSPYCVMVLDSVSHPQKGITMAEVDSSIFYDLRKTLSRNALFFFILGERGVGKTFQAKEYVVSNYLKHGKQFIYLRRYASELKDAMSTFFNDLLNAGYFKDHEFKVKGSSKTIYTLYVDGEPMGYGVALSTSSILKSSSFPLVNTIIYDEFTLEEGVYHYLKNEVHSTLNLCETVFRLRDDGKVLFLGNSVSIDNPFFNYFDLSLPYNSEYKTFKDGLIVVNYIKNLPYREAKKKTRFGKLTKDTPYGRYAIDNEMLNDNNDFVEKKGTNPRFWHILVINNNKYGVWRNAETGRLYISEDFDPCCTISYAITIDDATPDTKFISIRNNGFMKVIIEYYKNSDLYFESLKIKNEVVPILRRCLSYT